MELRGFLFSRNSLVLAILFGFLGTGCSQSFVINKNGKKNVNPPNKPDPKPPEQNAETLKRVRASLAVRGMDCLMCHAQIRSNVVTTFGYGTDQFTAAPFFGGGLRTAYNNGDRPWDGQGSLIQGSVVVPKINVDADTAQSIFGLDGEISFNDIFNRVAGDGKKMIDTIAPQTDAQGNTPQALIEAEKLEINYPTEGDIAPMVAAIGTSPNHWALIRKVGNDYFKLANQSLVQGLTYDAVKGIVRNSPDPSAAPVLCMGDVVIDAPVYLKNLKLTTDRSGCRIYSSHTVFLEGPILYVNTVNNDSSPNLQVASARGIFAGFSLAGMGVLETPDPTTGRKRKEGVGDGRLAIGHQNQFDPANLNAAIFDDIATDAQAVGTELTDGGGAEVPYQGVLFAAPHVHSHYTGTFKGVIVADIAVFKLQAFSFEYDTRFDDVPTVLPLLPKPLIDVSKEVSLLFEDKPK